MERRVALTLAGTAAVVVSAGAVAMAANLGILAVAGAQDNQVGKLDSQSVAGLVDPTTTTTAPADPVTVVVDEYVEVPDPSGFEAPAPTAPRVEGTDDDSGDASVHEAPENPAPPVTTTTKAPSTPTPTTTAPRDDDRDEHEVEPPETDEPADD